MRSQITFKLQFLIHLEVSETQPLCLKPVPMLTPIKFNHSAIYYF